MLALKNEEISGPSPSLVLLQLSLLVLDDVLLLVLQLIPLSAQVGVLCLELAGLGRQPVDLLVQGLTDALQLRALVLRQVESGANAVLSSLGILLGTDAGGKERESHNKKLHK